MKKLRSLLQFKSTSIVVQAVPKKIVVELAAWWCCTTGIPQVGDVLNVTTNWRTDRQTDWLTEYQAANQTTSTFFALLLSTLSLSIWTTNPVVVCLADQNQVQSCTINSESSSTSCLLTLLSLGYVFAIYLDCAETSGIYSSEAMAMELLVNDDLCCCCCCWFIPALGQ